MYHQLWAKLLYMDDGWYRYRLWLASKVGLAIKIMRIHNINRFMRFSNVLLLISIFYFCIFFLKIKELWELPITRYDFISFCFDHCFLFRSQEPSKFMAFQQSPIWTVLARKIRINIELFYVYDHFYTGKSNQSNNSYVE